MKIPAPESYTLANTITKICCLSCIGLFIFVSGIGCSGKKGKMNQSGITIESTALADIQTELFGKLKDGSEAFIYTLTNPGGIEIDITNYGGIITSIRVPDKNGTIENVVLGFGEIQKYIDKDPYFGALVGRYANRIADATFQLNGNEYELSKNDGDNHLHGGDKGFNEVLWDAKIFEDRSLQLSYVSEDGEEGYPGNLEVTVTYSLTRQNGLKIEYEAVTDKITPVNLTSHGYFNLSGNPSTAILDHLLTLNAGKYTPVDSELIPTGEIKNVEGTPFDFTEPHKIGARIGQVTGGYDHNFVLNPSEDSLQWAATLYDPGSGREMKIYTTEPGIQFYSGNFLDGSLKGPDGIPFNKYAALCLETQHFPNSPNEESFPSTILHPGQKYHSVTIYSFSTR